MPDVIDFLIRSLGNEWAHRDYEVLHVAKAFEYALLPGPAYRRLLVSRWATLNTRLRIRAGGGLK